MSLRLQNENILRGSRAADPSRSAHVKPTAQVRVPAIHDANAEESLRKVPEQLKQSGKEVLKAKGSQPEIKPDNPCATERVENIDADDGEYLEFSPDYVRSIYDHLFEHETKHPVRANYLKSHPELTPKMRMCLIEWMLALQNRFKLHQDTLLLSVSIMDRMLSNGSIKMSRGNFQLFGGTCLWVAAKYEEMLVPSVKDFMYMCADLYTRQQFREMEARILIGLAFEFSKPLSSHFLRRFSKAGGGDPKTHVAAKYLIELSLFCYALVDCRPSLIAASALFVAGKATGEVTWDDTVQFYSRYKAETLKPVALRIATMAVEAQKGEYLKLTLKKYSCQKFYSVPTLFTRKLLDDLFPVKGSV